jgi:hypothetical protein
MCDVLVQIAESQRHLAQLFQCLVKFGSPDGHGSFREIDRAAADGVMRLLGERRAVVKEDAVEVPALATLVEVIEAHPVHSIGHVLRALLAVDGAVAPEKEVAVDENCCGHGGKRKALRARLP